MSAGSASLVALLFGVRRARILIRVSASGTTTVELDAVTRAGNTVSFARARARCAGHAGWAGAVGGAGAGERWYIAISIRVGIRFGVGVDVCMAEASGQLIDGGLRVICGDEVGGLDWVVWLWALDLRGRNSAASGNFLGHAAGAALGWLDSLGGTA